MPSPGKARDRNTVLAFDEERGQWLIRFWDEDTGQRRKRRLKCGASDRKEADRQFAEFLLEADRARKERELVSPTPGDPTLKRSALISIDRVLAFYGERQIGTPNQEIVGYHMQRLLPFWTGKMLSQIDGSTCRGYVKKRTRETFTSPGAKKAREVTESTARRELETLGAAVGAWHKEYTLDSRPLITLPAKSKAHPDWLTDGEYERLLRVAKGGRIVAGDAKQGFEWVDDGQSTEHLVRFLELTFSTGSRAGVMLGLGWEPDPERKRGHVDFGTTTIFRLGPDAPVTRKRGEPCRIPDRILPLLRAWHAADMAEKAKVEAEGGAWVDRIVRYHGKAMARIGQAFENAATNARLEIRDIDGRHRLTDKALGLPTPHILRHSKATLLLRAGVPPIEVAEFLSMSLKSLLDTYGHTASEYQRAAAAAA